MNYLENPISAICLDDKNFPNEIKISNRPVKDKEYTIIATAKMIITGELSYQLAEIETGCQEYWGYKASRFGVKPEDIEKLFKIQEDIDISELMEEYVKIEN